VRQRQHLRWHVWSNTRVRFSGVIRACGARVQAERLAQRYFANSNAASSPCPTLSPLLGKEEKEENISAGTLAPAQQQQAAAECDEQPDVALHARPASHQDANTAAPHLPPSSSSPAIHQQKQPAAAAAAPPVEGWAHAGNHAGAQLAGGGVRELVSPAEMEKAVQFVKAQQDTIGKWRVEERVEAQDKTGRWYRSTVRGVSFTGRQVKMSILYSAIDSPSYFLYSALDFDSPPPLCVQHQISILRLVFSIQPSTVMNGCGYRCTLAL
jgi:hypothetical protein